MTEKNGLGLPKLAVIVLAAGSASRFGSPKQLAVFQDRTLLSIALSTAHEQAKRSNGQVVLVTGAYADEVESAVTPGVELVHNQDWQTGMGSSIRAAINSLDTDIEGAMILLVDQPFITESHLQALVECWYGDDRSDRPWAVATQYRPSLGVPALFNRKAFEDLAKLDGDQGARVLLNSGSQNIKSVEPDFSLVDIDTTEQLKTFIAERKDA